MLATVDPLPAKSILHTLHSVVSLFKSGKRAPCERSALLHRYFDETWYNATYGQASASLSGFAHYLKCGAALGCSPNSFFDERFYLAANGDVASAIRRSEYISGFEHFIRHGKAEGRSPAADRSWCTKDYSHLAPFFDEAWYNARYDLQASDVGGLRHYVEQGARAYYSPSEAFDESFYRAFYKDIREAVRSGVFISGFEHFVLAGRLEGRLPKHDLDKVLEKKFPGITRTVGIAQADYLSKRLTPVQTCSATHPERFWFLLPCLNPDVFFGGYKAALELIAALNERGKRITLVICEQDDDGTYAQYLLRDSSRIAVSMNEVTVINRDDIIAPLGISTDDKVIAYSAWEAQLAHTMAARTRIGKFAWLVQEYEPIFHDNGAEHVITSSAYDLPHYPIFNSHDLLRYFVDNRLGIFARSKTPVRGEDFAVFEHVLTELDPPSPRIMLNSPTRKLLLYARPEAHAKRNLFPLALLALRNAVSDGLFTGDWEFHGVGSLTAMTIDLGRSARLHLHAKMPESEYRVFMRSIDVGISLMYAPHPGLVAFEMASIGARVVTNVFTNRSASYLRSISENIIPCDPTVSSIQQALQVAVATLDDIPSRVRGMKIHRHNAHQASWNEVFGEAFFAAEMTGFLGDTKAADEPGMCLAQRRIA
jgi:hypothetical protein